MELALEHCANQQFHNSTVPIFSYLLSVFKNYEYSFVISQQQLICNNNLVKQHTSRMYVSGTLTVAIIKFWHTYAACRYREWLHSSKVLKQ